MGQTCATASNIQNSFQLNKSIYKGPYIMKEKKTYILKELFFFDRISFLKAKDIFDYIIAQSSKKNSFILPIKEYRLDEKELMCIDSFQISLLLENYKRDLESEIKIRQTSKKKFTDEELFGLSYSVLKGLVFLKDFEKDYSHGSINLNNIVLSQNGVVNLIEGNIGGNVNSQCDITSNSDLKDLALVLYKMINLDIDAQIKNSEMLNEDRKILKDFLGKLQKGSKPLSYFLSFIKKLKEFKKKEANKENNMNIVENSISFGDNSHGFPLQENEIPPTSLKTKQIYNDGSYYEGQMKENLRHGEGNYIFSQGGVYKGNWNMGKMDGYGVLFYANGKVAYEGNWKDDVFEGKGNVNNENTKEIESSEDIQINYHDFGNAANTDLWKNYSGDFIKDKKNGVGTLKFRTGEKFVGNFVENQINGKGVFYKKDGTIIKGNWRENIVNLN